MGKVLFFKGVVFGILFFSSQNVFSVSSAVPSVCPFDLAMNAELTSEEEAREFWKGITGLRNFNTVSKVNYLNKSLEFGLTALRRAFVVALGVGAVIGTGTIAKQYTDQDIVATGLMLISTTVFIKLLSPVDRRYGPNLEKLGHIIWGPGKKDVWGRIMSSLNENEREKAQQIYSQMILIYPLFAKAKKAIKKGKIEKAAEKYISAFLLSRLLFAMLHLDDPATLIMVQTELPKKISQEVFDKLVEEINKGVNLVSSKALDDLRISREEFREFTVGILNTWFARKLVP